MAFKPTEMQKKAIKTRGNVLVSAAAGSGKTAVLVERVASMLIDEKSHISADRLLIVTFTNAAAAEMRSRIEKRLFEEIQKDPNNEHIQKQKYLLQNADIGTIDSFCIKLVRQNFEKLEIEPDFSIMEESEKELIARKLAFEIVTEQLENPSEEFKRLLELVNCEYDTQNLVNLLFEVHEYSQQMPFPHVFIQSLYKPYITEFTTGNVFYDLAFKMQAKRLETAYRHLQKMEDTASCVIKNIDAHQKCVQDTTALLDDLKLSFEQKDWDALYFKLKNTPFPDTPSTTKDDEYGKVFKSNKTKIKKLYETLGKFFNEERSAVQKTLAADAGTIKVFTDMLCDYTQRLFETFRKENAFTFYNMEQMALHLLCEYKEGEIIIREDAKDLCSQYDEVLVDEFQDVNDLQDTLFYVLSNREERLFVVGDIKQSIYGFRGSNPANFLKKKNRYVPIDSAGENDSKKIILSDNFRSRKGVCDAVNFFFSQLLAGQCGEIIYDKDEYLYAGNDSFPESDAPTAEILIIDKSEETEEGSLRECESQKIADYILSVMNEGDIITDGEVLRKARFSDFAILLDTFTGVNVIANTLKSRGIPVSLNSDSFLESIEISSVISLLQVIDNPKNDVSLLEVMMSPTFAFTAEEMAIIRTNRKKCPLYSAVLAAAENGDKKCSDFVETLSQFRRDAAVLSVDRLISKIIHSTDILNMVSALPSGKSRKENLFTLINYAKKYSTSYDLGIYGFLKYITSFTNGKIKRPPSSGTDSVKIITMHGSKGLQFPVCIIAKLASPINTDDSSNAVIYSEKGGISFRYYDEQNRKDVEMFSHKIMAEEARIKTTEEKLRLLYVALTRAVDRLCLVCATNNLESKLSKLADGALSEEPPYIKREFLEKELSMGNWILSCMLTHPCGDVLRDYIDADLPRVENDARINIIFAETEKENYALVTEDTIETPCNTELVEKIKSNFQFEYGYEKLRHLQAKASVSRLVHAAEDDRFDFSEVPTFMLGDKLTGAARGTAMHHIMQFINMTPTVDVNAEIERLIEWKFITEREAASCDIAAIETFFASEVYNRIMSAIEVHREMRFLTEIPAKRIDPTLDIELDDANVIVQGAVDLCFVEDDGIVVLDFKTDKVNDLNQLVDCYGEQLEIYSTAAEKIFSKPVKEKIIYSFHLGKSISF